MGEDECGVESYTNHTEKCVVEKVVHMRLSLGQYTPNRLSLDFQFKKDGVILAYECFLGIRAV